MDNDGVLPWGDVFDLEEAVLVFDGDVAPLAALGAVLAVALGGRSELDGDRQVADVVVDLAMQVVASDG